MLKVFRLRPDFKKVFRKILHRKYRLGLIKNAAIQKKGCEKKEFYNRRTRFETIPLKRKKMPTKKHWNVIVSISLINISKSTRHAYYPEIILLQSWDRYWKANRPRNREKLTGRIEREISVKTKERTIKGMRTISSTISSIRYKRRMIKVSAQSASSCRECIIHERNTI